MHDILLIIFAYLVGSIPFGLLLTRYAGLGDIREIGSGNIGATNVLRTGNKKLAALTLICDALKGAIPVICTYNQDSSLMYMAAMAAILGHIFPVWLRFKGGKGVATALGAYLAINPLLGLLIALVWLLVAKVGKISSLSALVAFCLAPLLSFIFINLGKSSYSLFYFSLALSILILFTHRQNIHRLITGKESKI
ncbi:MAG: glycerol-3-phosphate 1-O-acyltransferase PlsY [Alphaproteobacteria bacterium]|nr:glycerol-3-phosphate 1-O-acyltransferase PlsY [Alphaproteobacteria bacterium]